MVRDDFARRFSFCCSHCRRRVTAVSVRFLGRRVHLALAMVLLSERGPTPAAANRLARHLAVSPRTIARWRQWWRDSFPVTALWRTMCGRFMPPPDMTLLPGALLARFTGDAYEAMRRLLAFLTPLTGSAAITLQAGR